MTGVWRLTAHGLRQLPLTVIFTAGVAAALWLGVGPAGADLPEAPPSGPALVLDPSEQTRDALREYQRIYGKACDG